MKLCRQLFALILALAWVPMLHSCEIAHALGVELTHQDDCAQPGSGDCDHCDFCQTVHAGGVAPSVGKVSIRSLTALIDIWPPLLTMVTVEAPPSVTPVTRSDQNRPPQRWQFMERAALPPRAPSVLA